jgi:hypothetical protein
MEVNANVVGQAQLNSGMSALMGSAGGAASTSTPMTWSMIWFGLAIAWILVIYFGFGGLRGSVAS